MSPPEQITSPAVFTEGMPWAWVLFDSKKYHAIDIFVNCLIWYYQHKSK